LDQQTRGTLKTNRVVDITTIGRKTGQPRCIETHIWPISDGYVIRSRPGRPRQ
jgi:hypothetical protein